MGGVCRMWIEMSTSCRICGLLVRGEWEHVGRVRNGRVASPPDLSPRWERRSNLSASFKA